MDTKVGVFDRAKWLFKEGKVATIVQRLQNHKASFTLMLSILQWYVNLPKHHSLETSQGIQL